MARAEGILRLLIIDDSLTEADNVINVLRIAGHAVRASRLETLAEIEQAVNKQPWDLLLCRDQLPAASPRQVVALINRLGRDLPCIVMVNDREAEAELYDAGAQDIVLNTDTARLQFAVNRELDNLYLRRSCRRYERALRESEKRSRALLDSSRDAVAYMHEGMHIYVNRAYLKLFGYEEAEDVDGLPILDLISSDDHPRFKSVYRHFSEHTDGDPELVKVQCLKSDGTVFMAQVEFSHARVEGEDCTQVVIRDDRLADINDSELQLLRDHDLLTGLYGRNAFIDLLDKQVFSTVDGGSEAELLYIVLDDFQAIKEQVGLGNSDVILRSVAELLRKVQLDNEVLGRYGDQVFTVLIPSSDDALVNARAEAYRQAIAEYISLNDGKKIDVKCSIGISRVSENLFSAQAVLENADRACMQAQRAGGNQFARFEAGSTSAEVDQGLQWGPRLRSALEENGFALHYQPIVSLHGAPQEFYEVLLRLKNGEDSLVYPGKFINDPEVLPLMPDIDKWVIRTALGVLTDHHKHKPRTRFFIKLTEATMNDESFVDWLDASLKANNIDGKALIFQISETAALNNLEQSKRIIDRLQAIGCDFGLEHFGSGLDFSHSLTVLDVDYLKINGTFVENMTHDAENQEAVKAIIEMTKQAGKNCIAEFVSDANSLAMLWRLGVDYAQGYYIQEPSEQLDYNFDDED